MSFLLKILKGTNAGAEIALAEGAVSFGSGDACDIVIDDSTLAAEAFSVETTADSVSMRILPDGEAHAVELYSVFAVGAMEFAIGVEGETWPTLKRPETKAPEPEPVKAPEAPKATPKPQSEEPKEAPKKKHGFGCLVWVLVIMALLLVAFAGGYWLALKYERSRFEKYGYSVDVKNLQVAKVEAKEATVDEKVPEAPKYTIEDLAKDKGLSLDEKEGVKVLSGNFKRRIERLEAAAKALELVEGVKLDLSDDETLKSGASETLFMLTGGKITVEVATNRFVKLVGNAHSHKDLLNTVAALCADVNRLKTIDDTAVVCEDGKKTTQVTDYRAITEDKIHPFITKAKPGMATPKCPVAGIIVTPYPCLVLRDGSRAAVGSEISGWTITKIEADNVMLKRGSHEVKWKP